MEGLGLSGYIGVSEEAIKGAKPPKLKSKTFIIFMRVNEALEKLSDEELDEVIADCRNGKWNKKLPSKPWYFGLLSKKKKKERFLYLIEFSTSMKKHERQCYKDILNDAELMGKIRDAVFGRHNHGCGEEEKETAVEGKE